MVTEDQIISGARVDRIAGGTAQNEIVAASGRDVVGTAISGICRHDNVDIRRIAVVDDVIDETVITQNDVVTVAGVDRVVGESAENDVIGGTGKFKGATGSMTSNGYGTSLGEGHMSLLADESGEIFLDPSAMKSKKSKKGLQ